MNPPLDDLLGAAGPHPRFEPDGAVRFSIVVRTQGRRPRALIEALASIADQTHPPHQVLVMVHDPDPATTSAVAAAVDSADFELVAEVAQVVGGGRTAPLNAALEAATGQYVCFLDDDDLARPDWLSAFDLAIQANPGQIARARTGVQDWATEGTGEPRHPIGRVEEPFASRFDLLAHVSHNETPICSVAMPLGAIHHHGVRFADELPVLEDWDFLMHLAPLTGVVSINAQTSLYRRLDTGGSDTEEDVETWERAHAQVIGRMSGRALLLPAGDAQRVASAHFAPAGGSRHETDVVELATEIDQLTRSPARWGRRFGARALSAVRARVAARRP